MKLKRFCTAKKTINKMKRQHTEWKNIFANNMTNKGLISNTYTVHTIQHRKNKQDFPGGPVVNNQPANAGDTSSIPGLGRFHIPCGK